jgi:hypothetical protein
MVRALSILTFVMSARLAIANPRIAVVVSSETSLPALEAQLQLHGSRTLSIARISAPAPVGARATELMDEHGASWVVWIERDANVQIVYVASKDGTRELARTTPTVPIAELERIVALKLAGLLDPVRTQLVEQAPAFPRWRLGAGAAFSIGDDRGLSAGPALAIDRRLIRDPWTLAAGLRGRWMRSGAVESATARVSVDELAAGLQLELARRLGDDVELFASLGITGSIYLATGRDGNGRSGSASVVVPSLRPQVGFRVPLAGAVLSIEGGFEYGLIRQRFLVDGAVATDLERMRAVVLLWIGVPFG